MSLLRFFVAPADERGAAGAVPFAPPAAPPLRFVAPGRLPTGDLVVLAEPEGLELAAGGAAAGLRHGSARVACLWPPRPHEPARAGAPALPRAGRCARRLEAHGLDATAVGALVRIGLPAEPSQALAHARRARTVAEAPVVIALARRDPALDVLLREAAEVLVLAGGDPTLTGVILEQASLLNPSARIVGRPRSAAGRAQMRLGLRALAPGRDDGRAAHAVAER